ncbi:hypothetical protein [Staphylococcus sp. EZ-P03]|uniref:hypothetical protein n=1 Tax=Staphylococcus sp. EZ-P03 TaxID=2282739 RepID=UPI000DF7C686|nr:hypothetical protein [Staphylococcus sp. EZ-P03]
MVESRIKQDLVDEKEISKFLDCYFYSELPNHFDAIQDIFRNHFSENNDDQYEGVDLTITYKNNTRINIDEKAANNYFDKNIPTFALEISFFNANDVHKAGWLFGKQYSQTDTYLLCWGKSHNPNKPITMNNIKEIEAFSIRKKDLLALLNKYYDINPSNYKDKAKSARAAINHPNRKGKIYLKGNSGPYWVASPKLKENPLNIVCPKSILEKVTRYKFYVTEEEVKYY